MPGFSKYSVIVIIILFVSCAVIAQIVYFPSSKAVRTEHLEVIPRTLGEWQGRDITITEDIFEILQTRDVLLREYRNSEGKSLLLAIVFSDSNRNSFHPPEMCYLGGGAELLDKGTEEFSLGDGQALTANKLVLHDPRGDLKAWYWYAAGNRFVANYYLQQLYFLIDAVRGKPFKGALIRVSYQGTDSELDLKTKIFIKEVMPFLKQII